MSLMKIDIGNGRVIISNDRSAQLQFANSPSGLLSSTAALTTQENNVLDGGVVSAARATTRRITVDFIALGMTSADVSRLFPARKYEVISITRNGSTRYTYGYRDGEIELTDQKTPDAPIIASVSFLCPDAFLYTQETRKIGTANYSGGVQYPLSFPIKYGVIDNISELICPNDGDYDAPFILKYKNTVVGSVQISIGVQSCSIYASSANSSVILDTKQKMVWINGVKKFNALTGSFPLVPVGGGALNLSGLSGAATVEYQELYEGV